MSSALFQSISDANTLSAAPSIAMSEVAAEGKTVQIAFSPIELPKGKGEWTFRIAQPVGLMATAIVQRMREDKVKTVGFIGFADAYGETWLKEFQLRAEAAGIQVVGVTLGVLVVLLVLISQITWLVGVGVVLCACIGVAPDEPADLRQEPRVPVAELGQADDPDVARHGGQRGEPEEGEHRVVLLELDPACRLRQRQGPACIRIASRTAAKR